MQQHFKLLIVREVKTAETEFARTGSEQTMPDEPTTLTPSIQLASGIVQNKERAIESNWRVKYGMKHSQQCFAMPNASLKLDPFDQSGLPA